MEVSRRCIAQTGKPPMPYSRAMLSALASEQKFRHGGPPTFNLRPVPYPNLISQNNCEASIEKREERELSCCSLIYRSNEVRGRLAKTFILIQKAKCDTSIWSRRLSQSPSPHGLESDARIPPL